MGGKNKKSKKPSVTKSWQPNPERIFFLDENIGGAVIADALRGLGIKVELHRDHFAPGTPDVDWLSVVAERGWVVLTRDQRIRQRPNELEVVKATGARMVVVTGANMTGPELAAMLAARMKGIDTTLDAHPDHQIVGVAPTGRISDITPRLT